MGEGNFVRPVLGMLNGGRVKVESRVAPVLSEVHRVVRVCPFMLLHKDAVYLVRRS